MRKPNANKAVPLDAVAERRTTRCSLRFRPGGRFCGLSFRYLSPGIEGEKRRPLDHMWQIPFIYSAPFIVISNFHIYMSQSSSYFLNVVRSSPFRYAAYLTTALAFLKQHSFQNSERLLKSCCAPYGTCCFVLAHDSWHFRMRWTNEIVHFLVSFPYSFVSIFRLCFFVVVVSFFFFQNKAFYL